MTVSRGGTTLNMVAVAHVAENALIKASARFENLKQFSVVSFVKYVYKLSYPDSQYALS
jgi:hypothetical protein